MTKSKNTVNKELPYGWRKKVQQILSSKGFEVETYTIDNVRAGRNTEEKLTAAVAQAVRQVKLEHKRKQKRMQSLRAVL